VTNSAIGAMAAGRRRPAPVVLAAPDLVLDWDTGNISQWTAGYGALEAGAPAHQSTFSQAVRRGTTGWSWRTELHNNTGDRWTAGNSSYRCLLGKYDSQEGPPGANGPSDLAWAFSFRVAQEASVTARLNYSQIWELHHRSNMYNVPGLSLAPHAIELIDGDVFYRVVAGSGNWNGTTWTGWNTYRRNELLLANFQMDLWYDVVVRIKCSEGSDGICQVWIRTAGSAFSSTPQFAHTGPTLPFIPGGLDPAIPTKIDTSQPVGAEQLTGLYLQAGLYNGSTNWQSGETTQQQIVYFDEMRRFPTSAAAMAAFPA